MFLEISCEKFHFLPLTSTRLWFIMTLVRYLFKFICTPTSVYKLFKVSDSSTYTYIHIYIHVQLFSLLLVKLSYLAIKHGSRQFTVNRTGGSRTIDFPTVVFFSFLEFFCRFPILEIFSKRNFGERKIFDDKNLEKKN